MIEYEIDGNQGSDSFTSLPHCQMHHFIPAFLGKDLEHGHCGLMLQHPAAAAATEKQSASIKTITQDGNFILHCQIRQWKTYRTDLLIRQ